MAGQNLAVAELPEPWRTARRSSALSALICEDDPEAAEIDLRLVAGRGLETNARTAVPKTVLRMGRLATIKTLAGLDLPSSRGSTGIGASRWRSSASSSAMKLFTSSAHPEPGKSHLATALGVKAVNAGKSVYFTKLTDLIASLARAEREADCRSIFGSSAGRACSSSMRFVAGGGFFGSNQMLQPCIVAFDRTPAWLQL